MESDDEEGPTLVTVDDGKGGIKHIKVCPCIQGSRELYAKFAKAELYLNVKVKPLYLANIFTSRYQRKAKYVRFKYYDGELIPHSN